MQLDEFAQLSLPPEVVALGRPDRVEGSPALAPFARWASWSLGGLLIALASAAWIAFHLTAPPDVKANLGTQIASSVLTLAFLSLGLFLLWLGSTVTGLTSIYAFYRETLAFVWNDNWTIIRWDDVREILDPGLTCLYARLVLQDGSKVSLRNHFFAPTVFYNSIKERVDKQRMSAFAPTPYFRSPAAGCPPAAATPTAWTSADPYRQQPFEIDGSYRKKAFQQLALGGALLLIALVLLLFNGRWINSAIAGPVPMTLAELRAMQVVNTLTNPWVTITYNNAIETDLIMVSTRKGTSTNRSRYLLIQVGDRWLIADVPHDYRGNQLTGYLDAWWSPLSREVIEKIGSKYPAQKPLFLPFQMNAEYSYRGQCAALVAIISFLLISGVVPLWNGWRNLKEGEHLERLQSGLDA